MLVYGQTNWLSGDIVYRRREKFHHSGWSYVGGHWTGICRGIATHGHRRRRYTPDWPVPATEVNIAVSTISEISWPHRCHLLKLVLGRIRLSVCCQSVYLSGLVVRVKVMHKKYVSKYCTINLLSDKVFNRVQMLEVSSKFAISRRCKLPLILMPLTNFTKKS